MKTRFIAIFFIFVGCSFAGDIAIGFQNGIGQSIEIYRRDVNTLWGYRGNIYSNFEISKTLLIQPMLSYSQKGSNLKIYQLTADQSGRLVEDRSFFVIIESRSNIGSFSLGIEPYMTLNNIRLFFLAGPRIDYLFNRTLNSSPYTGELVNRWAAGLNIDFGINIKMHPFWIGLVLNNEIDLTPISAGYESFNSYKCSMMLDISYIVFTKNTY